MKFIHGISGFAKEVDWLIHDIYMSGFADYRPDYFVCEDSGKLIGSKINGVTVVSDTDFFSMTADQTIVHECFIAIGSPSIREKLANNIKLKRENILFPNLIHPSVKMDNRNGKITLGLGNIVCAGTVLTTDISLENFVHLNLNSTVGHDSRLGSFCTLSPGVQISGNVTLQDKVFIGTGASVIEGITIFENITIGAGAVVVADLLESDTYVGIPAKTRLKK